MDGDGKILQHSKSLENTDFQMSYSSYKPGISPVDYCYQNNVQIQINSPSFLKSINKNEKSQSKYMLESSAYGLRNRKLMKAPVWQSNSFVSPEKFLKPENISQIKINEDSYSNKRRLSQDYEKISDKRGRGRPKRVCLNRNYQQSSEYYLSNYILLEPQKNKSNKIESELLANVRTTELENNKKLKQIESNSLHTSSFPIKKSENKDYSNSFTKDPLIDFISLCNIPENNCLSSSPDSEKLIDILCLHPWMGVGVDVTITSTYYQPNLPNSESENQKKTYSFPPFILEAFYETENLQKNQLFYNYYTSDDGKKQSSKSYCNLNNPLFLSNDSSDVKSFSNESDFFYRTTSSESVDYSNLSHLKSNQDKYSTIVEVTNDCQLSLNHNTDDDSSTTYTSSFSSGYYAESCCNLNKEFPENYYN